MSGPAYLLLLLPMLDMRVAQTFNPPRGTKPLDRNSLVPPLLSS